MVATQKTIFWLSISFISSFGYCQDSNSQINRSIQAPRSSKMPSESSGGPRTFSVIHSEEHQESSSTTILVEPFTPIEATSFTDPNYHQNLIKSQNQQQLLDATPLNVTESNLTKEARLLLYTTERNKHAVGSYEYNALQGKIDNLMAND